MGGLTARVSGARTPTGWLATRWLRRRLLAMVPLALIVTAGTAATMVTLAAAQSTSAAYGDYLQRAAVGDVVLNPSVSTQEIDAVIRSLPNIEQVTTDVLFNVTNDDGQPRQRADVEGSSESFAFVRGSHDGRYTEMDRPVVRSGRMPAGPREAVLTVEAADAQGLEIGDVVLIAFWQTGLPDGLAGEELEAYATEEISPIGVEQLLIVGIVTLPDEVLPDELFPRQKVIVSPDVAARYDCLPATPPRGSTLAEAVGVLLPSDCAASYRYYSLSMTNGAAGVKPALDEFVRVAQGMNADLADISDLGVSEPPQYFLIPTETKQELDRVQRSVRPTVTALVVLGVAAGAVTVALAGLLVARELRRTHPDQRQWHQLGVGSAARAVVAGLPPIVAAAAALLVGIAIGWWFDIGPVGLVRTIGGGLDHRLRPVALLAAATIGVATMSTVAVLAGRAARRPDGAAGSGGGRAVRRLAARAGSPAVADGLRAAYGPRAAAPVVAGGALLASAFVAATVFGSSLSALVSTPRSYGWPWDIAAMTGFGYGDLDLDTAQTVFDADPDVESWTALGFLNEVSLDGEPLMSMLGLERTSDVELPVLSGALPVRSDEIAVGATTAAERGLAVGDAVEISGAFVSLTVTVTGIVVFPSLGPGLADRVGTGTGMLLPEALFEAPELGDLAEAARGLATFVGIDVRDGADSQATMARLREQLSSLDLLGVPPFIYPTPVRPPEIVDAGSTRTVPVVVGVVLATTAAVGLAFTSWASVRSRRRDLAVLRALGFSGSQIRRSVRVHSLAMMLGSLALGAPIGLVVGRVLWRGFADQLGVVPDPVYPWLPMLLAVAAGIVLAILAAQIPAHLASHSSPAEGLRTE